MRLYLEAEQKRQAQEVQAKARAAIRALLASGQFKGQKAKALRLYAGLDGSCWRTYTEVAKLMRVSKQNVHQLLMTPREVLTQLLVPWK